MYDDALPRKRKNDEMRPLLVVLAQFLGWLTRGSFHVLVMIPLRWAWRVTVWASRIVWQATRWSASVLWQATLWTVKAPVRGLVWLLHGLNILINGRMPEFETTREREIYRRIKRRFRRRNRLYTHILVFVVGIALLWIERANRLTWSPFHPLEPYVFFTVLWTALLVFHYMRVRMGEAEDAALEAALEREYEREAHSQPMYYEEIDEYYGEHDHLADEPLQDSQMADWPKAKRRRMNS